MSRSDSLGLPSQNPFPGIRPINVLHLKEILDRVYFGSVVVDDKGIITFLSQPYADFLGVDREAVIGRHVTEVIENTRMHIVVQVGEVEIGRQRIRGEELVVQRVPIRDETGQIIGAFGQVMFKVEELHDLVHRLRILESKVAYYEQELHSLRASRYTFDDIVGESFALKEAKRLALRAARSMSPVLLLGETGCLKIGDHGMPQPLSPDIRRLLDRPNFAHLATLMPDGSPQSAPVWVGREGDRILVCTGEGSLKARNTRRDPRIALSIVDMDDPYMDAQLRGRVVERRPDPDLAFMDPISQKYTGKPFPFRSPEGRVALVIEVERARYAKLPFEHTPPARG